MSQINIQFPWFVLVDNEDESLLVVMGSGAIMVAIFTCQEFAELYSERVGGTCTVFEIPSVSGRLNDTSEGRFKRYQLKTKGLLLSRVVFSFQETRSRGRNGLSTGHGQDLIYQAVTRQRDV